MVRFFGVLIPARVIVLLIVDVALLGASYVLPPYLLMDLDPEFFLIYDNGLLRIWLNIVVIVFGFALNNLYGIARIRSKTLLIQRICLPMGLAFLVQAVIGYASADWVLPRWLMLDGSALAIVSVSLWRILYTATMRGFGAQRILFVGGDPIVFEISRYLHDHPELSLSAAGYLSDGSVDDPQRGVPLLGTVSQVAEVSSSVQPSRISVCDTVRESGAGFSELLDLRILGVPIEEVEETYEAAFSRVCARQIRPEDILLSSAYMPNARRVRIQSAYSFVLALVGAIVTLPLMLALALLVRISFRGSVLVRTRCAGLNGREFTLLRFRYVHDQEEAAAIAGGVKSGDRRLSRTGWFVWRFRLYALPQLWNVLRGDMAIVGPRPDRLEFAEKLAEWIPYYPQRWTVKPGLIGWAQINSRRDDDVDQAILKLEYDLYYLKNLSTWLDVYIIFHSFRKVVFGSP